MTGFPTFLVELDDGTDTFPYDITAYVETQHGWSITRGRGDEQSEISPSVLSCVIDNHEGIFTPGVAFGGGIFGAGPFGGIPIYNDQRIRWTETVGATTSVRFTGYVQDWPTEWPGGGEAYAVARITAVDRLARLQRRKLRSSIDHELSLDDPFARYRLNDPVDSLVAQDSSTNLRHLPLVTNNNVPAIFGATFAVAGAEGATCATFDAGAFDGGKLQGAVTLSGALTIECFLAADATFPGVRAVALSGPSNGLLELRVMHSGPENGKIYARYNTGGSLAEVAGPNVNDGVWRHIAATWNGTNLLELLVNGVSQGTIATVAGATFDTVTIGEVTRTIANSRPHSIAEAIIHQSGLLTATIQRHSDAGLTAFVGDSTDERVTRIASYANIDTADLDLETGVLREISSATGLAGTSPLDALQKVALTEGGLVLIDGEGKVVFQNRSHRRSQATASATFDGSGIGPDVRFVKDMQQVRNDVAGTRPDGVEQRATNQDSVDVHEQYPDSIELQVTTDQQVRDRIDWIVGVYAEPFPRVPGLTADLLSHAQPTQEIVLALEISDRVDLTGLPFQAPSDGGQIVEGWTESGSDRDWRTTFNTSPFEFVRAWILEDPVYGVLGETTRLGF